MYRGAVPLFSKAFRLYYNLVVQNNVNSTNVTSMPLFSTVSRYLSWGLHGYSILAAILIVVTNTFR